MSTAFIPVKGRDAGPAFTAWINPAHVVTATFWDDDAGQRVVSLELVGGRKVDLRERQAINAVGRITRGGDDEPQELPPAASCRTRRLGVGRPAAA